MLQGRAIIFNGFVDMINFFSVRKIIDNEEVVELCEHITNHYDVDGDFDRDSLEYDLLIEAIIESKK